MTDKRYIQRTLYEAMGEWIKQNVPTTKQKETWQKEADAWRLPYWDFARFADRPPSTKDAKTNDINHDKIRLPVLCMMPNVRINVFDKVGNISIESRPNPLFKYVTPKLMGELPPPYTIAGEHIKEEKERDPQYPNDRTRDRVVNPAFTYPVSPLLLFIYKPRGTYYVSSGINVMPPPSMGFSMGTMRTSGPTEARIGTEPTTPLMSIHTTSPKVGMTPARSQ